MHWVGILDANPFFLSLLTYTFNRTGHYPVDNDKTRTQRKRTMGNRTNLDVINAAIDSLNSMTRAQDKKLTEIVSLLEGIENNLEQLRATPLRFEN